MSYISLRSKNNNFIIIPTHLPKKSHFSLFLWAVYRMSLSKSFCTKELITKCFLALFAVLLMALRVTVLCLGSDLACGRVTTGSEWCKTKNKTGNRYRLWELQRPIDEIEHQAKRVTAASTQPGKSDGTVLIYFELISGVHWEGLVEPCTCLIQANQICSTSSRLLSGVQTLTVVTGVLFSSC